MKDRLSFITRDTLRNVMETLRISLFEIEPKIFTVTLIRFLGPSIPSRPWDKSFDGIDND